MTINTIHKLFELQAHQNPNFTAVVDAGRDVAISYEDLNKKANQLAHYLRELGVGFETFIGLCFEPSIELFVVLMGILKAGGVYVPLESSYPSERLAYILNNCQAPIIIIDSRFNDKFIGYKGKILLIDKIAKQIIKQPKKNPKSITNKRNLAYVIYTSGSTGLPKGVLIEHQSVANYARWMGSYSNCRPQERIDFSSPYVFDMAVTTTIVPLMLGLTSVICQPEDKAIAKKYLEYINKYKISLIKITPSYFKILLKEAKIKYLPIPKLTLILGGENLLGIDCASWLSIYPLHVIFNEYGPTETTVAVTHYKVDAQTRNLCTNVPIGKPGHNMYCYILNDDLSPVKKGEKGQLYIGGICLARGYLNQSKLTAEKFIKDPFKSHQIVYKSGDLCRELPGGEIECIGRIDFQIKIRGFRVEIEEIEKNLLATRGITAAVVVAREEPNKEARLIAYYTKKGAKICVKALRQELKKHLPAYMIPSTFVKISNLPLTASGKLDKSSLPAPKYESEEPYLAPSTNLQRAIAKIWSVELDIKRIGIEDDYFELGGHSLSGARIVSDLNNQFNLNLGIKDLYNNSTIAKLAKLIRHENKLSNVAEAKSKNLDQSTQPSKIGTNFGNWLPLSDFQFLLWISRLFHPSLKKINIVKRKRLSGKLNIEALNFAFETIVNNNEIFFYKFSRIRPMQYIQPKLDYKILVENLESESLKEAEALLSASTEELINYDSWHKYAPLVILKLFILPNGGSELQLCIAHTIADDFSLEVLFIELSKFYLNFINKENNIVYQASTQFKDYLLAEQQQLEKQMDLNLAFWQKYLKDTHLFTFPPTTIINAKFLPKDYNYSTYVRIPIKTISNLQKLCISNQFSINSALFAALALALCHCCKQHYNSKDQPIFMYLVKSTREDKTYDQTIGCFLRMDAIKVEVKKGLNLVDLSKNIHLASVEVSSYQSFPGLAKLIFAGSLGLFTKKKYTISLLKIIIYIYKFLFRISKLDFKILNLCAYLASFKQKNDFIINLNLHPNFLYYNQAKSELNLFNFKAHNIDLPKHDLIKTNNCLDICFLCEDASNTPYIVVSANLRPDFRELIAQETLKIIQQVS